MDAMKNLDKRGYFIMLSRNLAFWVSMTLAFSCSSTQSQTISSAASLRQYPFQQGLQQGLIQQVIDDNTVRVILTDTGAMSLGQCTDAFGSPLPTLCATGVENNLIVMNGSSQQFKFSSLKTAGFLAGALNKGIFGQYIISETAEISGAVSAIGSSSDAKQKTQRHQVVYEWSKYAVVGLEPGSTRADKPMVSSADFGFAVRMILDVVIRDTSATANLNLGPGQLEAALALGIAEVSIRHQVLGMRMPMLSEKSYTIKSYSDVEKALEDFHGKAKVVSEHWEKKCISNDEATNGSNGEAIRGCNITPVMLAYYVNGQSVGRNLRDRHRLEHKCNAAEAAVNELAAKKMRSKNAMLSDSDWKRYRYAEEIREQCDDDQTELAKLNEIIVRQATSENEATPEGTADSPGSAAE